MVILAHLHWDHTRNRDPFPEAEVLVQEAELPYAIGPGRYFRRGDLSPESAWQVPRYIVPTQMTVRGVVEVGSFGGTCACSDSRSSVLRRANCGWPVRRCRRRGRDLPESRGRHSPSFHVDVDAPVNSLDLLRNRSSQVLPSHDYSVFRERSVTLIT